jgi:hypothetical protein
VILLRAVTVLFVTAASLAGCSTQYNPNSPPRWEYADCYRALQRGVATYYEGRTGLDACDRMKADDAAWRARQGPIPNPFESWGQPPKETKCDTRYDALGAHTTCRQ